MILLQTLFVISGLGILVRFISNLASGDLLCIVNDLSDNKTNLDIRSFQVETCDKKCCCYSSLSGPFHISLSAYAAQEPGCKDKVKRCPQMFSQVFNNTHIPFMSALVNYGAVFMLMQVGSSHFFPKFHRH